MGIFNVALTEEDVEDIMTEGLVESLGFIAVEASGKLATCWAELKTQ